MAEDDTLLAECRLDFFKATGKGGQKRNKTSSAVRIIHLPSGIQATDCTERSQHRNRTNALTKLRFALAFNLRAPTYEQPDLERLGPLSVARLFDLFTETGFDHRQAADKLGVSPSKMLKMMSRAPHVFAVFNEERAKLGLAALHP